MKNKMIIAFAIVLLCTANGCGTKQEASNKISVQPTVKEENKQEELSALPTAIQDVLYNAREFYDVERKQNYTKSSYKVNVRDYDDNSQKDVYWEEYLVIDLDKDGEQELLARLMNEDSAEPDTRIFDVEQEKVYCYSYNYRSTIFVYEDGVIHGSSGAADNSLYSLKFENGKAKETRVAETISKTANECDYYVGEKQVSYEEYFKVVDKYYSQDGEKWIEFGN